MMLRNTEAQYKWLGRFLILLLIVIAVQVLRVMIATATWMEKERFIVVKEFVDLDPPAIVTAIEATSTQK